MSTNDVVVWARRGALLSMLANTPDCPAHSESTQPTSPARSYTVHAFSSVHTTPPSLLGCINMDMNYSIFNLFRKITNRSLSSVG